MREETIQELCRTSIFAHLTTGQLSEQLKGVKYDLFEKTAGALIALQSSPYNALIILLDGRFSAEIINPEGRVVRVESIQAPVPVAAGILFAGENFLPVQLIAETPVRYISIHREDVITLASRDIGVMHALLKDAGDRIAFLGSRLRFMSLKSLEQKIATYILELRDRQAGETVRLPYSLQGTAELFGVSRPSLSRSISLLVEEGVLERQGKSYRICDISALKALR